MTQNFSPDIQYQLPPEATHKMLSRLAITTIIITIPFAIYNFVAQEYFLAIGACVVIGIFAFNAWSITIRKTYHPRVTFWLLAPVMIIFLSVAIFMKGIYGALWTYPIILGIYCMLPEKKAYVINGILLLIIIPSVWINMDTDIAFRLTATIFLVVIFSGIFINVINEQQQKLQQQVITDPLTNLLNRTLLKDTLEQAVEQNHRMKIPMTIAIFDLDSFKNINDSYGHDLGDQVLQDIAKTFTERCRKVDRIFRMGGEEFLIFFYNTDNHNAINLVEELRIKVQKMDTIPGVQITTSAGLATLQENEDWKQWVKRCDKKQYQAKLLGRNRIVS